MSAADLIEYDIDEVTGCWIWGKAINSTTGYGLQKVNGVSKGAHRFVYETLVAPIPEGMELDHLCRNRSCVNPDHLEPVTSRENILRGDTIPARNAAKTHCVRGHEFSGENLYVPPSRPNSRFCRACRKLWQQHQGTLQGAT